MATGAKQHENRTLHCVVAVGELAGGGLAFTVAVPTLGGGETGGGLGLGDCWVGGGEGDGLKEVQSGGGGGNSGSGWGKIGRPEQRKNC
jgi:hypothetical protein